MSSFVKVNTSSWETVNEDVFIRFINQKYLDKYSVDIVHKEFLDLAMCISVQEKKEDSFRSHMLTHDDLENYGIDADTAFASALYNTDNARSLRILTPSQHMCISHPAYPLLGKIEGKTAVGLENGSALGVIGGHDDKDNILMIADKRYGYGSSYISSHRVLEEVFNRFEQNNFYIVPMNTFHVMCIKSSFANQNGVKSMMETEDDLVDMLEAMNDKCKDWRHILSYKLYYYFGNENKQLFLIR